MKNNNHKDINDLVSILNSNGKITFCSMSLDNEKIITLVKNSNNYYDIYNFKILYNKNKLLKLTTINNENCNLSEKECLKNMQNILSIISSIKDIEIDNIKLNLPDYYFNINENNITNLSFGWDLDKKKKSLIK